MAWAATAIVGGSLISGYLSSSAQSDAAQSASDAQSASSAASIAEQKRQFDAVQKILAPYVTAGTGALTKQQDLVGLNGNTAQQSAIDALKTSPEFTSMLQQGENSILANASATGGLRGGNTQAALAQFSPQLLSQVINDQYTKLGGITSLGQNSAAMTGNAGMQTGTNISNLLQQQGAAQAGAYLAQGKADASMWNSLSGGIGTYFGLGGGKAFGIEGAKF